MTTFTVYQLQLGRHLHRQISRTEHCLQVRGKASSSFLKLGSSKVSQLESEGENVSREMHTDPVNEIFRTSGFSQSSEPMSAVFLCAVTMLMTPFGMPAASDSSASASAEYGVSEAGLITTLHPAAIAAPTFLVIIAAVSTKVTQGNTKWEIPRRNDTDNAYGLTNRDDSIAFN